MGSYTRPAPDAPRRAAYDCLRAVEQRDAYANLVLPGLLAERKLEGRDAAFATELTYGTLRWLGTYDEIIAACASRPLADLDPPVRDLLRLGTHQLLGGMRVPPHAAVGETVELARAVVGQSRAGFVNAVLRKVGADDLATWTSRLAPDRVTDPIGHLSLVHAHPRWIVQAYADALGGDLEQVAAGLAAGNVRPAVHYVARPGRIGREELARVVGGAPGPWSPYSVISPGGDPGAIAAIRTGAAAVQDEGSQLVAVALANVPLEGADQSWLDLCAGPGGKAGLLAGLAGERGARLLAVELAAHRARLVRNALAGEPAADVVQADATSPAWRAAAFDRVLVDVPCSGLGALRRRPEARWRKTPADIAQLRPLQATLLDSAVGATRPGGVLAYVTCSPHVAETRAIVAAGQRRHPHLEPLDARDLLPGVPHLGTGPTVQLWPHLHGTDAMFLAVFRAH
ncbi:MAG: rRNA (cytosine967-C5)-methyltransferase [Frankiales bacterium]|jgi:16S rRNA (cytosine967-C5)-methyltransferase|nr:rRNA (cytosine967-C5)-methyltransferase [Frankiales bacterium]